MGCSCKNGTKAIEKLSDEPIVEERKNIFEVIFKYVAQFVFGIVCGIAVLVVCVPMLLFIIVCMLVGKQPSISLGWLNKFSNRKNR